MFGLEDNVVSWGWRGGIGRRGLTPREGAPSALGPGRLGICHASVVACHKCLWQKGRRVLGS